MRARRWFVLLAVVIVAAVIATLASGASSWIITSGSQIKDGVIPASKLTDNARATLAGNDGARGARGPKGDDGDRGARGPQGVGTQGPVGPQGAAGRDGRNGEDIVGPQGAQGPKGDDYLKGAYYSVAYYDVGDTNAGAIATVACSNESDTAISGGVSIDDPAKNVPVGSSYPGRMDWTTNTPKPGRLDGWIVQFAGDFSASPVVNPEKVKVYAFCVPGLSVPVTTTFTESSG